MKELIAAIVLARLVAPVWGTTRTVALAIPSMQCAMCLGTVKEALSKVPGLGKSTVSLAKKDAVAKFDDSKTTVAALTRVTRDAGYPSTVER